MRNNLVCKKIMSIIVTIIILLLTTKVYAANDTYKTTIRVNNSQIKKGETITVTIGLKDIAIESGEKGIGGYTASVKFDSSILEYVSSTGTDKWEAPFYQNGLITGNTKDAEVVKTTQDIGTITFKVKDNAKLGETTISLTNFSGSTVVTDVSASDTSTKITVVDDNNSGNSNNNNNDNNNSNDKNNNDNNNNDSNNNNNNNNNDSNSNNDNNKNDSNNNNDNNNNDSNNNNNNNNSNSNKNSNANKRDNTVSNAKLPKTGKENIGLIVCIGLVMICSGVCYIKMKIK